MNSIPCGFLLLPFLGLVVPISPILAQDMPVEWTLDPEPVLELGVVEGDPNQEFHRAVGSLRLSDGGIVVLNGGSSELLFFSENGEFVRRTGGEGGGPGEFRSPTRLYGIAPDSLAVLDPGAGRMVVLNSAGSYVRSYPMVGDIWMYRNHWIIGPRDTGMHAAVKQIIDAMPEVPEGRLRYVRVATSGHLWVLESQHGSRERPHEWTVFNAAGRPVATLDTPPDFEVQDVGNDYLLARERGEMDIEVIRLYRLAKPRGGTQGEDVVLDASADSEPEPPNMAALYAMRGMLRMFATAQFAYRGEHEEFATDLDRLHLDQGDNLVLELIWAGEDGWTAVARDRNSDLSCVMGVGGGIPLGWPQGAAVCG